VAGGAGIVRASRSSGKRVTVAWAAFETVGFKGRVRLCQGCKVAYNLFLKKIFRISAT